MKDFDDYAVDIVANEDELKIIFHEEIIQEIFRQLLIKNGIASDYVLLFEDNFKLIDECKGVSGTVNVFKNQNSEWNVWEVYDDGENYNIANFDNQIDAYIDAAKRRGLDISIQDFTYDENDIQSILNIIQIAKKYLKFGIDFYQAENVTKLIQRYSVLEKYEKEFINNNNKLTGKKIVRKKQL